MKTIDQSGDESFKELVKLARLYQFEDFAKQAELADVVAPEEPSASLYADVRTPLQFPCHNKAATYVSYAFFLDKKAEINPKVRPLIEARLNKFASYWGINNSVKAMVKRSEELNKEAEYPDSSYAIVWVSEDGHKERRYPLRNTMEVKSAADWYNQYLPEIRAQFGFADRATIANKILVKAAEYGCSLGDVEETLERCAGKGLCDPKKACAMLQERVKAASKCGKEVAIMMEKLAESVANKPLTFLDPNSMCKLAETVDQFDRAYGLLNKYTDLIPAPEDVLFSATYTKAASLPSSVCCMTTGTIYDKDDFNKISTSDIQDLFGDDITDAVCTGLKVDPVKLAEVASTFPRGEAAMFDSLMKSKGISAMGKQAGDLAGSHIGFTHQQLREMSM